MFSGDTTRHDDGDGDGVPSHVLFPQQPFDLGTPQGDRSHQALPCGPQDQARPAADDPYAAPDTRRPRDQRGGGPEGARRGRGCREEAPGGWRLGR
ncbi:hypothetical protein GCM10010327_59420 [Streptomyces nitrosporeus]|nr:hypothetical protein GCM10010327_59420 [Streptomyces nitrosporeus]